MPLASFPGYDENSKHKNGVSNEGKRNAKRIDILEPYPQYGAYNERDISSQSIDASPSRTFVLVVYSQIRKHHSRHNNIDCRQPRTFFEKVLNHIRDLKK